MIPAWLRGWVPPRLREIVRLRRHGRLGLTELYPTWDAAKRQSAGYDEAHILAMVDEATNRARSSEGALFERDGYLFDHPVTPYPVVACLLRASAVRGGKLSVLDFGGSLGSSYYQCRSLLSALQELHWTVVEQAHFVARGQEAYETGELHFRATIEDAAAVHPPDVILFSSVLQYLDDPDDILTRAARLGPAAVLIDRTPEGDRPTDAYTIQVVPESIVQARLAFRIFGKDRLARLLAPAYVRVVEFDTTDPDMQADDQTVRFRGSFFERRLHDYPVPGPDPVLGDHSQLLFRRAAPDGVTNGSTGR